MNPIIQSLFNRKSTRVYTDRQLEEKEKDAIINSALQAPTAGNQLLYTILEIEDPTIKEELATLCDNQAFIAKAPYVLVFLADCRRWLDSYKEAGAECRNPGYGDLLLAFSDANIAAQNTVVAAESLGIGSCYIGDIYEQQEKLVELLNLDPFVVPAAMLVYGEPTETQKKRQKPKRVDKEFIVQKNTYKPLSSDKLRQMFTQWKGEESDFDEYMKAFCKRKYMSDFAKEMSRSLSKYLSHFDNN
ncbi:nitroreductase family protein [Spirochaeta cellobiosiphila]|uniref:nitroreductase family protein n=1 Tax=Spirochaeta cellobiosiphila TaxID=504483 RepID=UPI0004229094|nr:nitroreductase family protein [Spirochaeta cellobiosiphila]